MRSFILDLLLAGFEFLVNFLLLLLDSVQDQRQFYLFCAAAALYFVQRQLYIFYTGSFIFCATAVFILCSGSFEKLDPLPARTLSFNLGFKLTSHGSEDRVSLPPTLLYWQLYLVIHIQLYTQWIQNMYNDICMGCPSPYNAALLMLLKCTSHATRMHTMHCIPL